MTAVGLEQVEGYQLSPQQQAVYLREGAEHRATHTVRSAAAVSPGELATRMTALVADHEVLRTRYVAISGLRMPVQVVDRAGPVSVEQTLGSTLLRAGEFTVEHSSTPDGTLLVIGLPRLSVDRTSWSMLTGLLLGEPADDATALAEKGQSLQYADVAGWLAEELERSALATGPEEALRPSATLPFLAPSSHRNPDADPETLSMTVDGPVLHRLRAVAGGLGVGEAALLLAAWRSLCARYIRDGDDQMLVVTGGRSAEGLGGVLGLLERPVAVRVPIVLRDPFTRAVRAAADALRDAAARECHADPRTVIRTGADRDAGPAVSFRYQWDRWVLTTEPGPFARSELPGVLHLDCTHGPESLSLTFAGTDGRVARSDLVSFAEAFEQLLTDALADSARSVGVLRMRAPSDSEAGSGTERHEPHKPVLHRFLEQAERVPDRVAVRCADEVLTYRELAQWAQAVGALLRGHGVQAGDHVPVLAPASADSLAAMLGIWLAGAAFVPIDPAWPTERIETVVGQFDTPLVLVPATAAGISLSVPAVPLPDRAGLPGDSAAGPVGAEGAAYVIFTSGTSGSPKGVVIGHHHLAHYAAAALEQLELTDGAGFAAVSTLAADLSYTAIFPTLANAGCVHLVDADVATSPHSLAEWFRLNPVSAMKLVPSHLSALLAEASDPGALLPREALVLGGEVLPRSLHDRLRELAPQLRVYNHYGPTETTIGASCLPLETAVDERCVSVPVGTGLGENVLTVVDDEGNPQPPWCPGEVLISGPGVGLGYLDEVRAGRPGFGDRGTTHRYHTGDLGRLVPGSGVEIIGRLDDQVKLRGHRVQLGEIEALLRRQPGVVAAAVVARTADSGLVTHLDAYVVRTDDHEGAPPAKDLQVALNRELPAVLVPTGWQLLDRLPLTRNGKLDRQALTPVEAPRAQAGRPRDPVEQRLLVLWAEVLEVDGISPEDDFFDRGGHSLRAIKLISRTNSAFGCRLPMSSIFTARTVAAMADLVRNSNAQDSNLVPLRHAKGGSPVYCIHPGGGSTLSYWELARLLPPERRFLGVESWGLHGRPPHVSFSEMAEDYAAAIAAGSGGPPVLVGWCFGGLMALETAQALRRTGHEVAKLIVIDCPAPGFDDEDDEGPNEALTESTLISRFAWHYELKLPSQLPPAPAAYELLLNAMQSNSHLPPTAGEGELRTLFDVYASNMTALERHFEAGGPEYPKPDYPVLLVRAEPANPPGGQDRTWGWRSLVGPGLSFASVVADHHSIMRSPAVAELAVLVAQALDATTPGQVHRD